MRRLPIACLLFVGCGGPAPVAPEDEAQGAARVFSLARDLEGGGKSKQAMAAYRQVVSHFPNTPEAREAADRITRAQRAAIRRVSTRRSK